MVKCQKELLLFFLLLLIHQGERSLPTGPTGGGLRRLSGLSCNILPLQDEILADSSSVLLNNPNCSSLRLLLQKVYLHAGVHAHARAHVCCH